MPGQRGAPTRAPSRTQRPPEGNPQKQGAPSRPGAGKDAGPPTSTHTGHGRGDVKSSLFTDGTIVNAGSRSPARGHELGTETRCRAAPWPPVSHTRGLEFESWLCSQRQLPANVRLCRPGGPALLLHTSGGRTSGQRLLFLPVSLPLVSRPLKKLFLSAACLHINREQSHLQQHQNKTLRNQPGGGGGHSGQAVRDAAGAWTEGSGTGPGPGCRRRAAQTGPAADPANPVSERPPPGPVRETFPEKHKAGRPTGPGARIHYKGNNQKCGTAVETDGQASHGDRTGPRRKPSGPLRCASNVQRRGRCCSRGQS